VQKTTNIDSVDHPKSSISYSTLWRRQM